MQITKEEIETLVELQRIENRVWEVRSDLTSMDEKVEALDERLKNARKKVSEKTESLAEIRKVYESYDSDLKANQSVIEKNREKMRLVKSNKEYQALLKGIDELKEANGRIEDRVLEYLEQIEAAEKELEGETSELTRLETEVSEQKEHISQEYESGKRKITKLDSEKQGVTTSLSPRLLSKFDQVKEQRNGLGVVPVTGGVCNGCNITIPPQLYNELHRNEELKSCPNCQRIIYCA